MTNIVRIVAMRELTTRLRDRTFLISTAVLLAIVVGSVTVPLILTRGSDRPEFTVAAVGPQASAIAGAAKELGAQAIAQDEKRKTTDGKADQLGETPVPTARLTVKPETRSAAEIMIKNGDVDAALVDTPDGHLTIVADSKLDDELSQLVALAIQSQQLTEAGLTPIEPPQQQFLNPATKNADIVTFLGLAFAVLFFMTTFGFGMLIAQSVVEEKQSRIVEILVAAIPVKALLAGKVLGNTALALGQVVLLLAVGLGAASAAGQSAVTSLLLHNGGWFIVFFVLGFAMLACLWAAAGALSSRQEDLQATTTPLQALIFVPFFISTYVTDPGPWLTALSYLPFTAPLTMPRRLLLGDAAWWEPILAAGGIVVMGALLILAAERLYRGGILRTGAKIGIRTAWNG